MEPKLDADTTYFKTYEQREEAFRKSVFALIPRKYSGPRLFWKDFRGISHGPVLEAAVGPIAYITGNPRDCLVFGTPVQALSAARMCVNNKDASKYYEVATVARRFGLEDQLHQPVRTLSGGESVKVALAKAFIAADYCDLLTVASPFTWLSQSNRAYLFDLVRHYHQAELSVTLLALEGEDSTEALPAEALPEHIKRAKIDFRILSRNSKIKLATSINPLYHVNRYAEVEDFSARMNSPCLLLGENGQGKSLVAKALAGAVSYEGRIGIQCRENRGPVRILLQDVVSQTLLRDFKAIRATAGRDQRQEFQHIYQEIIGSNESPIEEAGHLPQVERRQTFHSLLEMKAALMAVRLCGRPGALIMDEPDWGLNRTVAIEFVFNVISAAHKREVPVVLISHKPWWKNAAGSILEVQRSAGGSTGNNPRAFKIRIKKVL